MKRNSVHNGSGLRQSSALGDPNHSSYKWWVLANIMLGTFMAVLDATIVNVSLPKIMAAFGITVDKAEWVLTAYLLAFAVMLPSSGWFADHFGYKRLYMLALFLFTSGSFLCGLAWNENALIVFRVIQGLGGGIITPVGMAIVLREFPYKQRGTALGFWAVAAAGSVSFGPLIGGYLVDNFSWHSIFYVNVPVGIFAIFATWAVQREYKAERARSFDIVGFISMTVFLLSLLLALADGNSAWNTGGWTSTFIMSCFAIAAVSLVVFLVTEFTVEHPILELNLMKSFNYSMANIVLFIFGFSVFGSTFLLPLYLQDSLGYTAYQAGAVYLPMGLIQGIVAPLAGILADRTNPKIIAISGIVLLAWSWYLNGFLSLFSMHSEIMLPVYLRGFGMGLLFTPLSTIALSDIRKEKMAQASGLFNVIRQVGGSFGVAVIGSFLTARTLFHTALNGQAMQPYSPAYEHVIYTLRNFATNVLGGSLATGLQRAKALVLSNAVKQAIVQATDDTFLFAFGVMILCIIPILFLRTNKHKSTEHKLVAAE